MTEPEPPRPLGSHRRPTRGRRVVVLLTSLVAIAIVAFAVRSILHDRGEPAAAPAPAHHSSAAHSAAIKSSSPSARPSTPALIVSSTPSPTPTFTPTPSPSQTPTPALTPTPAAPARPALDVFNDSRITGLAARGSAQFEAGGWTVATTGNFKGEHDVPETTIFFPDAEKANAEAFAAQFRIDRVLPAPSGWSGTHLTVVLARDWAGRG